MSKKKCSLPDCERQQGTTGRHCYRHDYRLRTYGDPYIELNIDKDETGRFWAKVDASDPDGCWLWTGATRWNGYGVAWYGRKVCQAHRVVLALVGREPAEGMDVDHLCRNRACVNPDHLEEVTHRENVLRGEAMSAAYARRDHCKYGHPFTPDNIGRPPGGGAGRRCLTCHREQERERQKRVVES